MEYTIQWKNGLHYPAAVMDKYNGMRIGTVTLERDIVMDTRTIHAYMFLGYGSDKFIELENNKKKSWELNPELAAEAIWKYHVTHMSWKKRLHRWYQQTNTIWKVIGIAVAAFRYW